MNEPQPLPLWLLPLFPLFFLTLWLGVCGILSALGGWSALARRYREPEGTVRDPVASFSAASMILRRWRLLPVSYNRCVVVDAAPSGLHLRVWAVFRFRHPPLFLPWGEMEHVGPGTGLFWRTTVVVPRAARARILFYGGVGDAIEEMWKEHTAAQPATV